MQSDQSHCMVMQGLLQMKSYLVTHASWRIRYCLVVRRVILLHRSDFGKASGCWARSGLLKRPGC
jgi:hypothetical protein